MSTAASSSDILRDILRHPKGGVVGLVDDLLAACRDRGLRLDWRMDLFRVCSFTDDWQDLGELQLRKTVFRSILARLAALCNEYRPNSCSPYGGEGEFTVGKTQFHVVFTNTLAEQRLKLSLDRPAVQPRAGITVSMPIMSKAAGHPMLAALLDNTPRLLHPLLQEWAQGPLFKALDDFADNPSDGELADALVNLRQLLSERAVLEPWLRPIAEQRVDEYVGDPRALTAASKLKPNIDLPDNRTKNQFTVDQVRRLREALRPLPEKEKQPCPPPSPGSGSHEDRS